ncbi:MAG: site-specific DNA-methyltransferase [Bacillota bacterium]
MRDLTELRVENQTVYFKSAEHMAELGEGDVSLTVTSPPYWDLKNYQHPGQIGQEDYRVYLARLDQVWQECYRVSHSRAVLAINVNSRRRSKVFYPLAFDIAGSITGWVLVDILVWYIPNALPQSKWYLDRVHDNKFEFILVFAKDYRYDYTFNKVRITQKYREKDPRDTKRNSQGRGIGNVLRIPAYRPPTVKQLHYHAAAFPEELPYYLIHTYSNPGDLVLDPFAGSGTTLKVARNLGRPGVGYEINPDFASVMASRIAEEWQGPPFEQLDIISMHDPDPDRYRKRVPRVTR